MDGTKFLVLDLYPRQYPIMGFGSNTRRAPKPYKNEPDVRDALWHLQELLSASSPAVGTPAAIVTLGSAAKAAFTSLYPGPGATHITINGRQRLIVHTSHPECQVSWPQTNRDVAKRNTLNQLSAYCGITVNTSFLDLSIERAELMQQFDPPAQPVDLPEQTENDVQRLYISPYPVLQDENRTINPAPMALSYTSSYQTLMTASSTAPHPRLKLKIARSLRCRWKRAAIRFPRPLMVLGLPRKSLLIIGRLRTKGDARNVPRYWTLAEE